MSGEQPPQSEAPDTPGEPDQNAAPEQQEPVYFASEGWQIVGRNPETEELILGRMNPEMGSGQDRVRVRPEQYDTTLEAEEPPKAEPERVRVKRSSGEIEDDWNIADYLGPIEEKYGPVPEGYIRVAKTDRQSGNMIFKDVLKSEFDELQTEAQAPQAGAETRQQEFEQPQAETGSYTLESGQRYAPILGIQTGHPGAGLPSERLAAITEEALAATAAREEMASKLQELKELKQQVHNLEQSVRNLEAELARRTEPAPPKPEEAPAAPAGEPPAPPDDESGDFEWGDGEDDEPAPVGAGPEEDPAEEAEEAFSIGQAAKIINEEGKLEDGWRVTGFEESPAGITLVAVDKDGNQLKFPQETLIEWQGISPSEVQAPSLRIHKLLASAKERYYRLGPVRRKVAAAVGVAAVLAAGGISIPSTIVLKSMYAFEKRQGKKYQEKLKENRRRHNEAVAAGRHYAAATD